jgi:hypothetical protein
MKLQKLSYDFEKNPEIERFIGFTQKKFMMKIDTINRCNAVMKEEGGNSNETEEHFIQYLSPEFSATFSSFANCFLKNHSLFELPY